MARHKQIFTKKYLTMDKKNEALWALIAVIAMVVFMEAWTVWAA